MIDREKVIKGLECCINDKPFYHAHCAECPYNGLITDNLGGCTKLYRDALVLLKEQEESIPVSWLEEKLEGHPELPYTITDGINYVLDLWEGR